MSVCLIARRLYVACTHSSYMRPRPHTPAHAGEGAKPDLFLGSVIGPEAFFQSNVGLQFDEDSPAFRRRLRAMDESVRVTSQACSVALVGCRITLLAAFPAHA